MSIGRPVLQCYSRGLRGLTGLCDWATLTTTRPGWWSATAHCQPGRCAPDAPRWSRRETAKAELLTGIEDASIQLTRSSRGPGGMSPNGAAMTETRSERCNRPEHRSVQRPLAWYGSEVPVRRIMPERNGNCPDRNRRCSSPSKMAPRLGCAWPLSTSPRGRV